MSVVLLKDETTKKLIITTVLYYVYSTLACVDYLFVLLFLFLRTSTYDLAKMD